MQKNDFRRSFILMRSLRRGMTGHVRLERRTLQGSMRFTVQGQARGKLVALLLAQRERGFNVCRLGMLSTDSRGQSGLLAVFDPRNLEGLDLDRYTLVVIMDDAGPEMVLSGMVNGSKEINWQAAQEAAAALFLKEEAGAQTPDETEPQMQEEACCIECAVENAETAEPEMADEKPCDHATPDTAEASDDELTGQEERTDESDAAGEACNTSEETDEERAEDAEQAVRDESDSTAGDTQDTPLSACSLLGIDPGTVWPDEIAALKALFEKEKPTQSFSLDDFVFVEAPLPADDGAQGKCAIGLRVQDGRPVSVCYAIPGDYSLTPPPGLEGYTYLGGWWYTVLSAFTEQNQRGETISP